ncbi:hypothetical protein SNOG_03281 [Parastagonospora nodorum SN15]|uniref:Uncharacterized protein n=1 Tax=Phaeosphaeria nodorum (strain SN15 / ATCC MYA-4574 / FGSC 10173) TaxID=321614 RepID=Q0UY83_PHANO|nr:hypothetical protein SNOG_03281 [Parastagonospora nodorum SN15]EAT90012.1 hypothetical protein SNOG_03281 [Parastagonospora nodorum SN15]
MSSNVHFACATLSIRCITNALCYVEAISSTAAGQNAWPTAGMLSAVLSTIQPLQQPSDRRQVLFGPHQVYAGTARDYCVKTVELENSKTVTHTTALCLSQGSEVYRDFTGKYKEIHTPCPQTAVPRHHGARRRRTLLAAKWSLAINNIASIRAGGLRWPKVGDHVPEAIHSVGPRAQQLTRDNGR